MVDFSLYNRLNNNSKRAILKTAKRWGHPYRYNPRDALLTRLAQETGRTKERIREELMELRQWLLKHHQYY